MVLIFRAEARCVLKDVWAKAPGGSSHFYTA